MSILRVDNVSVSFGAVRAVRNVSLTVRVGEIAGLIGANGAGKSSLVDAVTGFSKYTGSIQLDGQSLDRLAPHQRARAGIARTWQSVELFEELSVIENLSIVEERLTLGSVMREVFWGSSHRPSDLANQILHRLNITDLAESSPKGLSTGQRRLVGIGRALAARPKFILMDEPSAGLDSDETSHLRGELHAIARSGIGLLLVEHDMDLVLQCCDSLNVMDFGHMISRGPTDIVRNDPRVVDAYLGSANRGPGVSEDTPASVSVDG